MIIVTGASSNHFHPLVNLLESLRYHERERRVVVYDLGLKAHELTTLSGYGHEVRTFDFAAHPPHMVVRKFHPHAWKPALISDFYLEADETVFWLDAGCLVHGPLSMVEETLTREGFYSPGNGIPIKDWAHPQTVLKLGASEELVLREMHLGGVVGFGPRAVPLLARWRETAYEPTVICPEGWDWRRHRSDQVTLSILLYQMQPELGFTIVREMGNISVLNDRYLPPDKVRAKFMGPPS